jgi:hypothetical protein
MATKKWYKIKQIVIKKINWIDIKINGNQVLMDVIFLKNQLEKNSN